MEHEYEDKIKCPYCDYEDINSWELDEFPGTTTCGNCQEEFHVYRHIEVTYSSRKISCEEKGETHEYGYTSTYIIKRAISVKDGGKWVELPESEWRYKKEECCKKCGDIDYITITKEEYNNLEINQ